jgi:hypothetical protein
MAMFLCVLANFGCRRDVAATNSFQDGATLPLVIHGVTVDVQLQLTASSRHRGMGGRRSVPPNTGMLFAFPEASPLSFVMRDCLVPLDIAFLDGSGMVIRTATMPVEPAGTPEWQLRAGNSTWPAQFVLEMGAGEMARLGLREGDQLLADWTALANASE